MPWYSGNVRKMAAGAPPPPPAFATGGVLACTVPPHELDISTYRNHFWALLTEEEQHCRAEVQVREEGVSTLFLSTPQFFESRECLGGARSLPPSTACSSRT